MQPQAQASYSAGQALPTPGTATYAAAQALASKVNVTSDSSGVRAANTATGNDINRYLGSFDSSALTRAAEAERAQIEAERNALNARRDAEVVGIESAFGDTKKATERAQEGEFASRSTGLITSGGGFLGATQSQQGVLQQLRETQRTEISALETKKQAAIRQAKNAYDDKDFALARDLVKSAREVEQQIYARQKDYADRAIQISRYNEQDKQTAFKNSLDVVDRTAAGVYDSIQGMAPAAKAAYITSMATNLGVDPNILASKVSEIELSKKDVVRTAVMNLAAKYVSAGIDPAVDDIAAAIAKVRLSADYKRDVNKANADIAAAQALANERNSSNSGNKKLYNATNIPDKIKTDIVTGMKLMTGKEKKYSVSDIIKAFPEVDSDYITKLYNDTL